MKFHLNCVPTVSKKVKLFHYANFRVRSRAGVSSALPQWGLFSMNDDGKLLFAHAPSRISRAVTILAAAWPHQRPHPPNPPPI